MINKSHEIKEPVMSDETEETRSNNVFVGPWVKNGQVPAQSPEEVYRRVAMFKATRIDEVTEDVILHMFEYLYKKHGYDFSEREDVNKDVALLVEALKSMLCKNDGLEHSFHKLAEQRFFLDAEGELNMVEDEPVAIPIEIDDSDGEGC